MTDIIKTKITFVWLLLIMATGLSWEFGHGFGFGDDFQRGTIAVLVVTMLKVRFVYLDFMELNNAPQGLRLAVEAWAIIIGLILIGLYMFGS